MFLNKDDERGNFNEQLSEKKIIKMLNSVLRNKVYINTIDSLLPSMIKNKKKGDAIAIKGVFRTTLRKKSLKC